MKLKDVHNINWYCTHKEREFNAYQGQVGKKLLHGKWCTGIIHPHPPGTAFNQPQLTILRLGFLSFPFLRKAENPDLCMKSYRLQMLVTNSIFYNYELATICL